MELTPALKTASYAVANLTDREYPEHRRQDIADQCDGQHEDEHPFVELDDLPLFVPKPPKIGRHAMAESRHALP